MTQPDALVLDRLAKAFRPNRPIDLPQLLSGRLNLLYRLQDDVNTPGTHVLLYGDRGVGKTSIARVLGALSQAAGETDGRRTIMVSCDSQDTFGSIWRKVFQEVLLSERQLGFEQHMTQNIVGRWDPGLPVESPNDVRLLLSSIPNPKVIIVDDFDRTPKDNDARSLMTDTIKLFSDTNANASIVLVGVGQSIEELVAAHQSISRNMDYVEVEPMQPGELAEIIQKGFASCNLDFEAGLDHIIAHLSQGYPHYTHLLGLWSGRKTAERGSAKVTHVDLNAALPYSIQNAAGGIRLEYDKATDSNQPHNLFREVLLACALADKDVRGRFALAALRGPLSQILNRNVRAVVYQKHLAIFCEAERGPALVREGQRKGYRWRFANPQLVPFVRMQGVQNGMITEQSAISSQRPS